MAFIYLSSFVDRTYKQVSCSKAGMTISSTKKHVKKKLSFFSFAREQIKIVMEKLLVKKIDNFSVTSFLVKIAGHASF